MAAIAVTSGPPECTRLLSIGGLVVGVAVGGTLED
jgi:hypothetical protein